MQTIHVATECANVWRLVEFCCPVAQVQELPPSMVQELRGEATFSKGPFGSFAVHVHVHPKMQSHAGPEQGCLEMLMMLL